MVVVSVGHAQSGLNSHLLIASQSSRVSASAQRSRFAICLLVDAQHPSTAVAVAAVVVCAVHSQSASAPPIHTQPPDLSHALRLLLRLHMALFFSLLPAQHPGSVVVVGEAVVVAAQSSGSSVSTQLHNRFRSHAAWLSRCSHLSCGVDPEQQPGGGLVVVVAQSESSPSALATHTHRG